MEERKNTMYCKTVLSNVTPDDGIAYGQITSCQSINPPSVPKSMVSLKLNKTNTYKMLPKLTSVIFSTDYNEYEHLYPCEMFVNVLAW